jgi:outer membrane protein TolC
MALRHHACSASLLIAGLASSPLATAQPAPPAPPPDTTADQPAPSVAPTAPAENEPVDKNLPEVSDAMLAPVPPPAHVLQSWQQALKLVRAQASTLNISRAQVEQAQGQARQALGRALPTLTANASVTHHLLTGKGFYFGTSGPVQGDIPNPSTRWGAGLELRVPVLAPQSWYDTGTARHSTRAARLSEQDTERLVLGSVADAIVTVVTSERLAEVSRVSLRSALSTLDLTKRRSALGAATAVDVLRAEQEVALARSQVVSANESLRRARESLGLSLGSADPYGVRPDIQLDSLARDARSTCRIEPDLDQRADIRAARAKMDVARRNVDSVDWQYLPTVDFVSDLNYVDVARYSPNGRHVTWTIGGVLSWQLYDGGVRYGQREQNEGSLGIARENLAEARRQAKVQVAQAQRAVRVAQANLAVSAQSRDLAKKNARLSRLAFINGTGTSFDLVDAAKRLREADLDLAVKQFEVVRARIAALLALASCNV